MCAVPVCIFVLLYLVEWKCVAAVHCQSGNGVVGALETESYKKKVIKLVLLQLLYVETNYKETFNVNFSHHKLTDYICKLQSEAGIHLTQAIVETGLQSTCFSCFIIIDHNLVRSLTFPLI